jgi:hypothetical protein
MGSRMARLVHAQITRLREWHKAANVVLHT